MDEIAHGPAPGDPGTSDAPVVRLSILYLRPPVEWLQSVFP